MVQWMSKFACVFIFVKITNLYTRQTSQILQLTYNRLATYKSKLTPITLMDVIEKIYIHIYIMIADYPFVLNASKRGSFKKI